MKNINQKQINLIRIGIYLLGVGVILFVIYQNAFKTVTQTFTFEESYDSRQAIFAAVAPRQFSFIQANILLKKEWDLDNFQSKTAKTFLPLLREKRPMITGKDALLKLLYNSEQATFPNGSVVEFSNTVYFVENGKLRPFLSRYISNQFGLKEENIVKLDEETFNKFEIGQKVLLKNIREEKNFLQGLVLKTDSQIFITGANHIYPIFSEKLIRSVWPNFTYIESGGTTEEELLNMQCYKISKTNITCEAPLEDLNKKNGNAYVITIHGVPLDVIEKVDLCLKNSVDLASSLTSIKTLLW